MKVLLIKVLFTEHLLLQSITRSQQSPYKFGWLTGHFHHPVKKEQSTRRCRTFPFKFTRQYQYMHAGGRYLHMATSRYWIVSEQKQKNKITGYWQNVAQTMFFFQHRNTQLQAKVTTGFIIVLQYYSYCLLKVILLIVTMIFTVLVIGIFTKILLVGIL